MIAVAISSYGEPKVLKAVEIPKPEPKPDEVLIRVKAAGVARADAMQRQGKYPPPEGATEIPGLDAAGVVESVGERVHQFHPGDAVCAILVGGGYAEYCVAPAVQVLPIPTGWSATEATTLPENLFTVYDNLITRAGLTRGETVLIHGGTSGVGSLAIMLSRALGAIPIATAGTDKKTEACLEFGAQHAVNYRKEDFAASVLEVTDNRGVDVILDVVGGTYLNRNVQALAAEGRIAVVAAQQGRIGNLDLGELMMKRGRIMGSTMRIRTPEQKGEIARRLLTDVWPLLPAKQPIWPIVDSTFPLADAARAHERLESGVHIGKIVLVTD